MGDTILARGMSGRLDLSNDFPLFSENNLVLIPSEVDEVDPPEELLPWEVAAVRKPKASLLVEYPGCPLGLPSGDGGLNDRDEDADAVGDWAFPGEPALGGSALAPGDAGLGESGLGVSVLGD